MAGYVGTKAVLLSTTAATVGGDADIGGDLTVDTNTLYVDSTNNRVGVGNASPTQALDVTGDIITSGGVYLGGTVAANKLDDYEEGTWTPVIRGSSGDPSPALVTGNTGGIYTKVGDTVFVSFEVRWSSITGGGGNVTVSGLPFTRNSTNQPDGDRSIFDFYGVSVPSGGLNPIASVGGSQTVISFSFTQNGIQTTPLTVGNLLSTNPAFFRASLVYKV